jgi:hypothetical protein
MKEEESYDFIFVECRRCGIKYRVTKNCLTSKILYCPSCKSSNFREVKE